MNTLRTFVAIELDEALKEGLQRVQDRLVERAPRRSVRWVRPEGIHLTLKFLGDTPVEKIEAVQAALGAAVAEIGPFAITLVGLGCFPDARRPQVLWVGVQEPTGTLARLRDAVEAHVAPLGFPTERRAFHPHLTLGRVDRSAPSSEVRTLGGLVSGSDAGVAQAGQMTVRTLSYIRSDLRPSGAVYTTLFEANLAAG